MADDKKKYIAMERELNDIQKSFVSLSDAHIRRNNEILKELIDIITSKMKEKNSLFKEMYTRVFYGGSFYDGLRVGNPDEFDLDLLLKLPVALNPTLTTSNVPGFVHLRCADFLSFMNQNHLAVRYKGLDKLLNDKHCLDTGKVLQWMESVVQLALNNFQSTSNGYLLTTRNGAFQVRVCKGGPAFTLKVRDTDRRNIELDIDMVPCFVFGREKWPTNGFRPNPVTQKPEFFIVPKPLKMEKVPNSSIYWRLSFQEQERILIDGKLTLKPTVRLLKKLRDRLDHKCIASYYLKTILIWRASDGQNKGFWNQPLSYVFMTILKDYQRCLSDGEIMYFWNKKNNLIGKIKKDTLKNMSYKIKAIIDDIDKHPTEPTTVTKYLLTPVEISRFRAAEVELATQVPEQVEIPATQSASRCMIM